MSEDTIKTKKKDKSTWKRLGVAVVAVGGLAIKTQVSDLEFKPFEHTL